MRTKFFSENPNDFCDELNLLLPEKGAGTNSNIIIEKNVAIFDKFLEHKCFTPTAHKKLQKIQSCIRYVNISLNLQIIFEVA